MRTVRSGRRKPGARPHDPSLGLTLPYFSSLIFPPSPFQSRHAWLRMLSLVRNRLGSNSAVHHSLDSPVSQVAALTSPRELCTRTLSVDYLGHLAKGTCSF